MRKSLFVLAALCMSTSGFAQTWVKPVLSASDGVAFSLKGEEQVSDTLYLYNVEAGGFLMGANDWNTRASVSASVGHKIIIKPGKTEGTYTLADSVLMGNAAGKISSTDCGGYDNIWIDGATRDGDGQWRFTLAQDGSYTITNDNVPSGNFGVAEYFQGATGNTRCFIYDASVTYDTEDGNGDAVTKPIFDGAFWDKWIFVTPDTYNAFLGKEQVYDAALALEKALSEAREQYPNVDFSSVEAVYNNTASTAEELNAAKANIQNLINNYLGGQLSGATFDNPLDATGYITNPSFETGNYDGWTVSATNANGKGNSSDMLVADNSNATYHCDNVDGNYVFNIWQYGNPITQTVKDLPEGIYSLEAMVASSDDCTNVYITADGGWGEMHHAIELEAPKQTGGTRGSFKFPAKGGDVIIGAVGSDDDGKSYIKGGSWWYKADDFKLTYYGKDEEAYQKWGEEYVEGLPEYTEDTPATTSLKNAYTEAVEKITATASKEDILSGYETVEALGDSLAANVKAYETLMAKINEWDEFITNSSYNGDLFQSFAEFVQYTEEDMEGWPTPTAFSITNGNYALETNQIDDYINQVEKLRQEAIAGSISDNEDCTNMLVNPAWTDASGKGWTEVTGKCTNKTYSAGLSKFPVAESYHSLFDFQQEINGVPDGVYSISLNGFCRLDGGEAEVPAEIYMNDFSTKLININDGGLTDTPEDGVNCLINADAWKSNPFFDGSTSSGSSGTDAQDANGNYIPNGMVGASVAFSADRYKATAYGLVQGGKMTIGVRNLTSTTVWALWSNFKLTYEGKNVVALTSVINSTIEKIQAYKENSADLFNEKASKDIDAILSDLEDKKASGQANDMWNALLKANTDYTEAQDYVKVYQSFVLAKEKMDDAANDYAETASSEALADYEKYSSVDDAKLTKEELQNYIEEFGYTASKLRVPKYDTASDVAPVDMTVVISSPSFEKDGAASSEGWTWNTAATGDTGVKDNSNGTYTISNADGAYVFNTWHSAALEDGYWISQTLKSLPVGTYKLTALVATDAGNKVALSANGGYGYEAALTTPKEEGSDFEVVFKVEAGQRDVEIKVASETWFKVDNFRLEYYGAESANETTGIDGTLDAGNSEIVSITTLSGINVKSLVKGYNIITKANGQKVKIYVK